MDLQSADGSGPRHVSGEHWLSDYRENMAVSPDGCRLHLEGLVEGLDKQSWELCGSLFIVVTGWERRVLPRTWKAWQSVCNHGAGRGLCPWRALHPRGSLFVSDGGGDNSIWFPTRTGTATLVQKRNLVSRGPASYGVPQREPEVQLQPLGASRCAWLLCPSIGSQARSQNSLMFSSSLP